MYISHLLCGAACFKAIALVLLLTISRMYSVSLLRDYTMFTYVYATCFLLCGVDASI